MTSKDDLFEKVIFLISPLGPLGSEEDRTIIRQRITSDDPLSTAIELNEIIKRPPNIPEHVSWNDIQGEIAELLSILAEDDRVRTFLLDSLFTLSIARPVILDSLALLASPNSGPTLSRLAFSLCEEKNVSDMEFTLLASALGASDGPEALAALYALRQIPQLSDEVKKEINIAIETLKQ